MEQEIRVTIEADLAGLHLPEEDERELWTDLEVTLAMEFEDLGIGQVEGGESTDSRYLTTAYTTHANWDAALTVVLEALRRRGLMHVAVVRKAVAGATNGGREAVVWPVTRHGETAHPFDE
jgi:hypothetical protein